MSHCMAPLWLLVLCLRAVLAGNRTLFIDNDRFFLGDEQSLQIISGRSVVV